MTVKVVQAVFFARYTKSTFRALYRRVSNTGGYTKDFLQVGTDRGDVLASAFGIGRGNSKQIRYVWPTGECEGTLRWSSDRWQLAWLAAQKPTPWAIAQAPTAEISIIGNPDLTTADDADAEHDAITGTGVEPWLIAIKVYGEDDCLHVRTYFRNPTPEFANRALSQLPDSVIAAINDLSANDDSNTFVLPAITRFRESEPVVRAAELVGKIQEALKREPNVLLVGPPGTGKTVALEDLQALYDDPIPEGALLFDTSAWENAWEVKGAESRSEVLVFHPSYSYENFVAGLYPTTTAQGISLEAKPGPLLCLSHWVGNGNREALLVIDEFNRGSAAAIFGDCLSLLDKDKRSSSTNIGARITRPYIGQRMPVPVIYRNVATTEELIADDVRLPTGVHIVAAMNSTDRSVAPLDAAMRRRFTVIRVGPDYEALAARLGLTAGQYGHALPQPSSVDNWQTDDVSRLAVQILKALNDRIEFCLGEDFLLGHALLWHITADMPAERLQQLAQLIDSKLIPTLRMTFVDQDEALAAILSVSDTNRVTPGEPEPAATVAYWKEAPPQLSSISDKRLAVNQLSVMARQDQLNALHALL
ncbi:AAA family ATPase [Burkholderia cepacia]|uniref:AAA family ATPase n=1 Tax=Burkholderia cepacia TaxID=292 RepID=UPI001CF4BF5A|nr:AAA family ATPase [Burkholderia cepacia]MCA8135666.1 AAA family ATPase [Burkholderia cepacia]